MSDIEFYSFIAGVMFMAVMDVFFSIANWFIERSFYFRDHRKLKQKLIQRLERKNDDINN